MVTLRRQVQEAQPMVSILELYKTRLLWRTIYHTCVASVLFKIFRGRIPSRGSLFNVDNPYISNNTIARLFWRAYESNEIHHVHKFLRRDLDVIELGGGIGAITLEIIRVQDADRRLICVEPNPHLIQTLEQNLQRNRPEKRVVVLNQALDYSGQSHVGLSITSNNLGTEVSTDEEAEREFVKAVPLTDLLKSNGMGEFVLVCDIEGAEAGMILEDADALARCQQMLIELHPAVHKGQKYSVAAQREQIECQGFRLVARRKNVHIFIRNDF